MDAPGPPAFDVEVAPRPGGAMMLVRGDMDIASLPRLERARDEVLADGPESVLVDLRAVGFVDSSGLKFLIQTFALARRDGWTLELLRPSARAMKVFDLTGAVHQLPFVDAVPDR
jgi:anti-sigma B factor antagonist